MMSTPSDPRIYILRAAAARRAVVFVKHTSKRWSVHQWDLSTMHVEIGGVFHGGLYPRRSDVSPDGRHLLYFAMSGASDDSSWPRTFTALSRAPWLTALIAWRETGTWTRGMHFAGSARGQPEIVDRGFLHQIVAPLERCPWNIAQTWPVQLAAERRIGWTETEDCPARDPEDVWDQHRRAVLHKPRPGGREELRVVLSSYLESGKTMIEGRQNLYSLRGARGDTVELPAYCWLDWLDGEHVYGATCDGRLVVCALRAGELCETWSYGFRPQPTRRPSPAWARVW